MVGWGGWREKLLERTIQLLDDVDFFKLSFTIDAAAMYRTVNGWWDGGGGWWEKLLERTIQLLDDVDFFKLSFTIDAAAMYRTA